MQTKSWRRAAAVVLPVAVASAAAVAGAGSAAAGDQQARKAGGDRKQSTQLISRSYTGGYPNGPSTHGVISNDRRYARLIAFQSDATNIVHGDTNGQTDIFSIRRIGSINNRGTKWKGGKARLVSRGRGGPANGASYEPAVSGGFRNRPSCVTFLSRATNIASNDTNGVADAFLSKKGRRPVRLGLPGNQQPTAETTEVAISGNCKRIAFVSGGKLYLRVRGRTRRISVAGPAANPAFATGHKHALAFSARRGAYLLRVHKKRARLVARGGRNPAFNDVKRQTLAYEVQRGGHTQIEYKDLGRHPHIISKRKSRVGNGDSRNPVIGNSGYYVSFESEATNLGLNALKRSGDHNGNTDVYLYTNVRNITLVQSVRRKAVPLPGGGFNPSMSFYANYILFDSPAPLGRNRGNHQVFMRYLGPV